MGVDPVIEVQVQARGELDITWQRCPQHPDRFNAWVGDKFENESAYDMFTLWQAIDSAIAKAVWYVAEGQFRW